MPDSDTGAVCAGDRACWDSLMPKEERVQLEGTSHRLLAGIQLGASGNPGQRKGSGSWPHLTLCLARLGNALRLPYIVLLLGHPGGTAVLSSGQRPRLPVVRRRREAAASVPSSRGAA